MTEMRFASAYEHAAEQAISDERVIGALPDDTSGTLLDWQLARLRVAAAEVASEEDFWARADLIRAEARSVADAAADAGDDAAALAARLGAVTGADEPEPAEEAADAAGTAPLAAWQPEMMAGDAPSRPESATDSTVVEESAPDGGAVGDWRPGDRMAADDRSATGAINRAPTGVPLIDHDQAIPTDVGDAAPVGARFIAPRTPAAAIDRADMGDAPPAGAPLTSDEPVDRRPLGVAALSAPATGRRRRGRSRKAGPDSAVVADAALAAGAEALVLGGRAARKRPWLALVLGVVLLVGAAIVLLVVLRGRDGEQQATEAPPLPGGGWYEVLFTTPQRTGTPPSGSPGRLDERLVRLIDSAERSVAIAAYDFGLNNVAEALIAARKRGIEVRVVTDSDNKDNPALKKLREARIPIVEDGRRALMHHKFAVIDGRTVLTGAWNFAERDTFRHDNNSVIWDSPELARNFTNEFDKMFEGRRFGPTKPKDVPNPVVERDGVRVETWFASEQQVDPVILDRLRRARSSIAFMAFSFTLDDLGTALQDRRKDGVGVWGVIETTGSETEFSEFGRLKGMQPPTSAPPFPGCKMGPAVLQDGNPFLLHHKVFVIDERTVILGSFNFTSNAAEDNDEALLIVDDPALAARFLTEFCRVYNVAVDRAATRR